MTSRRSPRIALSGEEIAYVDSLIEIALSGKSDPASALDSIQKLVTPRGSDEIPRKPVPKKGVTRRIEFDPTGTEIAIVDMSLDSGQEIQRTAWRASTPDEFWQEIVLLEGTIREALGELRIWMSGRAPLRILEAGFRLGGALARLADIRAHSPSQLTGQKVRRNLQKGIDRSRNTSVVKCENARRELRQRMSDFPLQSKTELLRRMAIEKTWGCRRSLMRYCKDFSR